MHGDCQALSDALVGLQFYLPTILEEVYDEWGREAMDGFDPAVVRKTGPHEMELISLVSLLPDCTVTPIHLRLQVSAATREIVWLECRVGEPGKGRGGLNRIPSSSSAANKWRKKLIATEKAPDVEWVFQVTFGQKRQ